MEQLSLDDIRKLFQQYDIRHNPDKYKLDIPEGLLRKASVLIGLFYLDGDYRIILTVRSKDLTHHAGYVAFPGGMQDDDDKDEIHTALREAEEEIGLNPKCVDIICVGFPGVVMPNTLTYPVIALVQSDFKVKMNEREVSLIFDLPLSRFLSDEGLIIRDYSTHGIVYHTHHFIDKINGQEVDTWGFTAGFCINTALVLYQSDKTFCTRDNEISSKDTVFQPYSTRKIISYVISKSKF